MLEEVNDGRFADGLLAKDEYFSHFKIDGMCQQLSKAFDKVSNEQGSQYLF